MGAEKHGSKGGGGWLHLFDWNAKSRKKLFSSKSNSPELSKQRKRCDGNMPVTLLHLVNEDDMFTGSSMKGSSDYSCASSVTDEELGVPKAPNVVARLMGLDSLTTSGIRESYSTLHFDTQSLPDLRLHYQYQGSHSGNLNDKMDAPIRNALEKKHPNTLNRPIEKFQSEILPPRSAKSIPITHHKLLSPIKSANFIPSGNAAHIMEVAARIIGPGPQVTAKPKLPAVGSSSVPLKVRDLKQKAQAAQKPSRLVQAPCLPDEYGFKLPNGASGDKKRNGSIDDTPVRVSSNSEATRPITKGKSGSISLALQAKANVQKREGLYSSGRSQVGLRKPNEGSTESFGCQPSVQSGRHKKPFSLGSSRVLQQNNQKQNCLSDRGSRLSKQSPQNSQGGKPVNGDSLVVRNKRLSNSVVNSRNVSRRSRSSEVTDSSSENSSSRTRQASRKRRSIDGNMLHAERTANAAETSINSEKLVQSCVSTEKERILTEEYKRKGTEVISFTFTAPLKRSIHGHETPREVQKKRTGFGAGFHGKEPLPIRDDIKSSKILGMESNLTGNDALSTLLDRTLRELNHGLVFKPGKGNTSPSSFQSPVPSLDASPTITSSEDCKTQESRQSDEVGDYCSSFSSADLRSIIMKHKIQGLDTELNKWRRNDIEAKDMLECRLPSPLSVLENSLFSESYNSSDTVDSFSAGGIKQSSSVQAQEVLGASSFEADTELFDSASSISARNFTGNNGFTSSLNDPQVLSEDWELEYVKEILSEIDVMFMDFTIGRTQKIIDPHLFDELKSRNSFAEKNISSPRRRLLFDCVVEFIDNKCRRYAFGGCKDWMQGLHMVTRKEKLARDIYKEISGWSNMGDCMVDELVDKNLSCKHGRWLDFKIEVSELGMQIENRILNVLLDEVIADIL